MHYIHFNLHRQQVQVYDAEGKRALKYASERAAGSAQSVVDLCEPVYYVSPLVTLTRTGYSKHYFEGGRRICTVIGGGFAHRMPQPPRKKLSPSPLLFPWSGGLQGQRLATPPALLISDPMPLVGPERDPLDKVLDAGVQSTFDDCIEVRVGLSNTDCLYKMMQNESERYETHEPAFYYHTDHLGSTSRFTDDSGKVVQTLAYMPYGEDWVDDSKFIYSDTNHIGIYQFNGKERDFESGFYYYGARYHWPELWTGWTSPDPLMDKYPGISPYNYCNWNPVIFVDPDGRDTFNIDLSRGRIRPVLADGNHCIRFWRDNKLLMDRTINDIESDISFSSYSFPSEYEMEGYTQYLSFDNAGLGYQVFDIIQRESASHRDAKEWDYYMMKSGGELSSSGLDNQMLHNPKRYTEENVKAWHHFHPSNNSRGWYPSDSDQTHAKNLKHPSFLYFNGEGKRFDDKLKDQIILPSEYGKKNGIR